MADVSTALSVSKSTLSGAFYKFHLPVVIVVAIA